MAASLSPDEALRRLAEGYPLEDCSVSGPLWLGGTPLAEDHQTVRLPISMRRVSLQHVNAACVLFEAPVCMERCVIEESTFYAAYFLRGLEISESEFRGPVTFMNGGHNDPGCLTRLAHIVFHEFVDFDDCFFSGPVEVVGCTFRKGSNLLYWARSPFGLGEAASLRIDSNIGSLDLAPKET